MFLMKKFDIHYQLNKENSVSQLHTRLHEPIQNSHSTNIIAAMKTAMD